MPTYTPPQAAADTSASMLLQPDDFWEEVYYRLVNSDKPVPQPKRI